MEHDKAFADGQTEAIETTNISPKIASIRWLLIKRIIEIVFTYVTSVFLRRHMQPNANQFENRSIHDPHPPKFRQFSIRCDSKLFFRSPP